jgi:hypothetical protein
MTQCEAVAEVGCESLPEDLVKRLRTDSSLNSMQREEVRIALNTMLYIIALEEEGE